MIAVDAHGHLHPCFDVRTFLERAHSNLSAAVSQISDGRRPACVLFVLSTSAERHDGFHRLERDFEQRVHDRGAERGNWERRDTSEQVSACLMPCTGGPLVIIAGCQVVSREGLEMLALGTCQRFDEGKTTEELIREVVQARAIPVLPWGVGKWLGRRGRLIEDLIESPDSPRFFLGDNANRPAFWPRPSHFRRAEEQGIRNLPGSDPLPFPNEVQRVGEFGVILDGPLDLEEPARHLKQLLLDKSTTFRQFGRAETPLRFVRNQLKMQYRKLTRS